MDHRQITDSTFCWPYVLKDTQTLIDDFCDEVKRALTERGVPIRVIAEDESEGSK